MLPVFIAPTARACQLASRIQAGFPEAALWTKRPPQTADDLIHQYGDLSELVGKLWGGRSPLVFVLATGAVVRLIAPLLEDKNTDPPVIVVDETGRYVQCLCGGHGAGGHQLARQVAALLGVEPILTTASESQNVVVVDILGEPYGWRRGDGDWLGVARSLTNYETVAVVQTCGWEFWLEDLPDWNSLVALAPMDFELEPDEPNPAEAALWISDRQPPNLENRNLPIACWHPRTLWIGVGCERGAAAELLANSIDTALEKAGLAKGAIAGLASLDIKQDEMGLLELAQRWDVPVRFYDADTLKTVTVPNPSEVVENAVGTPAVAEAACQVAASEETGLQDPAQELLVQKSTFRDESGACTVAVARSPVEYTPRIGELHLIGIGPGALDQITPAAQQALSRCDVIIGYELYLSLIRPLLDSWHNPQQITEGTPITKERYRAERAISLAHRGLTVGVISSGDCGIYAMAGLVLECLAQQNWDGKTPSVTTYPGITALQAAAARAGAPLMHDFCAISLSDLLTPWPVIQKRLQAAASADFVVALYNPKSKTRVEQIAYAFEQFRQWRSPDTPVIVARSLYRPDETITITTVGDIDLDIVDMVTVVIIGNQSTFNHKGVAITPRGYLSPKTSESN
ncbi:MAG: precorrin-3B C(17)-methyltransferase [Cyanobacteria bacterium P01_D01_bin.73]